MNSLATYPPRSLASRAWRLPTLGWLRVLLVLMVLDHHFDSLFSMYPERHGWVHIAPDNLWPAGAGLLAVIGFFVLSGFLVAHIVEERYNPTRVKDFCDFTFSRYLRLYPLYLIFFALALFELCVLPGLPMPAWPILLSNVLQLPLSVYNFFPAAGQPLFDFGLRTLGPAWTLPLDFAFYPLGFLLMRNKRVILPTLVGLALLQGLMLIKSVHAPSYPLPDLMGNWWRMNYYTTVPALFLPFLAGMQARLWRPAGPINPWWVVSSLVAVLLVVVVPYRLPQVAAASIVCLAFAVLTRELFKNGSGPAEKALGDITFGIYLSHYSWTFTTLHPALKFVAALVFGAAVGLTLEGQLCERVRRALIVSDKLPWRASLRTISGRAAFIPAGIVLASSLYLWWVL